MSHVKAIIWDYFKVSERNQCFAICQDCKNEVSHGDPTVKTFNTSNLINHLRREHPTDFKDYEEKKVQELKEKEAAEKNTWKVPKVKGMKQLSLAETEARVKPWDIKDPHAIHVHQKIAEMMALDFQPYSIVSDTGFTELLKTLEPRYTLPSRRYFTEDVVPGIANDISTKTPWCKKSCGQELKKGCAEKDVKSKWAAKASCC